MDTMDLDVEMDVDVDLVPDEPIVAEPELQDAQRDRSPGEIDDAAEDDNTLVPTKVYIRGLDVMNPDEVKSYVAECYSEEQIGRIEWIDDSSANLLFGSDAAAARALSSLALEDVQDVSQLPPRALLPAKPFSKRPEVALQVRPAVAADKKQAGAASRSRFYLLNPEYDPEERRRRDPRRYRERDGDGIGRRRARDAWRDDVADQFDASMYDDDQATLSSRASQTRPRRRRSYASDTDADRQMRRNSSYRNDNRGKELFPDGSSSRNGPRRDRSASPMRDRDNDRVMDGISNGVAGARNRDRARAIKSRMSHGKHTRELFPDQSNAELGRLGDDVDDTATLLAKGIMLPLMDESNDIQPSSGRRLEERITKPGEGKLADRVTSARDTAGSGFSIRGAASQKSTGQGFAIKGSAGKSAKELFPDKLGTNARKELFADGLEGRSRQRRRAGDLFD
ncbi:hypothetical protein GGR52DRAFT_466570 [Hypoxylon sp. FL1284]|nr:hypothetical protein GGR52DRAFT_466570 [Hypoxylon sp. FL1284]